MPRDCIDEKSALVQVMAWCRHFLKHNWPRFMSPYGVTHDELMDPITVLNPFYPSKHSICQKHNPPDICCMGPIIALSGADTLCHRFIEPLYLCVCAIDYATHVSLCSGFDELHVIHITNSIVMVFLFDAWYLYRPSNMNILYFIISWKTIQNIIVQASTFMTWFNIIRYCMNDCRNSGRTSIRGPSQ